MGMSLVCPQILPSGNYCARSTSQARRPPEMSPLSSSPRHTKSQEPSTGALVKVFPVLKYQENYLFLEGQGSTTSTSTPAAGFGLYCLLPGQGDGLRWGSKDEVPSMVPHLVFLPRILLPFTWYSWSLPTTANGIISCGKTKTGLWLLPENCSGTQTSEQSPTLSCFQEGFMG